MFQNNSSLFDEFAVNLNLQVYAPIKFHPVFMCASLIKNKKCKDQIKLFTYPFSSRIFGITIKRTLYYTQKKAKTKQTSCKLKLATNATTTTTTNQTFYATNYHNIHEISVNFIPHFSLVGYFIVLIILIAHSRYNYIVYCFNRNPYAKLVYTFQCRQPSNTNNNNQTAREGGKVQKWILGPKSTISGSAAGVCVILWSIKLKSNRLPNVMASYVARNLVKSPAALGLAQQQAGESSVLCLRKKMHHLCFAVCYVCRIKVQLLLCAQNMECLKVCSIAQNLYL